jgi:hypothetical protein
MERKKCNRCKMNLTLDKFKKKRDDTYTKWCEECLEKKKKNKIKNKCPHGKTRCECQVCDEAGYICSRVRNRVRYAIHNGVELSNQQYINTGIKTFREHIEKRFEEGMTWDNYGEWHIDHVIPLKYGNPTFEEVMTRLHYKNTQPLWAEDNLRKNNKSIV